jgi:hypothetical protein
MVLTTEYAALAAFIYNDQRGGGGDTGLNQLDLPPDWQDLSRLGFAAGDNLNRNPFSFTGGAYLNQSTGEIVIAYKGTDFLVEFSGRAWNTLEIKAEGWAFGRIDDIRAWVDGLAASRKKSSATHLIAGYAASTPAKALTGFKSKRKNHRSCNKLRAKSASGQRIHCAGSYEKKRNLAWFDGTLSSPQIAAHVYGSVAHVAPTGAKDRL